MTDDAKRNKYWALRDLVERCPVVVNGVRIVENTRLLLWCLAAHCDGDTDSTFIGLDTLMSRMGCTHNALDRAIANLTEAGLISSIQKPWNPKSHAREGNATRTVNRAVLEQLVVRVESEKPPSKEGKPLLKEARQILRTLKQAGEANYGPCKKSDAIEMRSLLNRLSPVPLDFRGRSAGSDNPEGMILLVSRSLVEQQG